MICAECSRCGRRSILSGKTSDAPAALPGDSGTQAAPPRMRCDLCGSRSVRLVQIDGPLQAVAFIAGRGGGR